MNEIIFSVKSWSAWTPNLQSKQDWQKWAVDNQQFSDSSKPQPEINFLSKMQLRRLSQLTKMSLKVAFECSEGKKVESVFASRFGEWNQTLQLLESISANEDISPAGFSLSVHNSAAGIYSMTNNNTMPYTAIAANEMTFESALIESLGRLENNNEILLIIGEEAIPELYLETFPENLTPFAMAFLLTKNDVNGQKISIRQKKGDKNIDSFQFLEWFLNEEKEELVAKLFLLKRL